MTQNKIFRIIIMVITFSSCNTSVITQEEIEGRANGITKIINKDDIASLKDWQFEYRGKGEIWSKLGERGRDDYEAYFFKTNDSTEIYIFDRFFNSADFPVLIPIDTPKFENRFLFTKYKNGKVKITGTANDGNKVIISDDLTTEEIFGKENPFSKLESLSAIKDRLKVNKIRSIKGANFIEFFITYQDVLTYIPDKLEIDPLYKQFWIENFAKGKIIKNNWNLRILDKPVDNG